MMLSRSLVQIEFRLGLGKGSKTLLGYTHVVEQLSFSIFPSILTFNIFFRSLKIPKRLDFRPLKKPNMSPKLS